MSALDDQIRVVNRHARARAAAGAMDARDFHGAAAGWRAFQSLVAALKRVNQMPSMSGEVRAELHDALARFVEE